MSPGATGNPEKLKAKQRWPSAREKYELRSFLGFCTCYSRFIAVFAGIAKKRTWNCQRFPEADAAF
jgi:hypothetical protein